MEKLFVLPRSGRVTAEDVIRDQKEGRGGEASALDGPLGAGDFRDAKRLFEIAYLTRKLNENGGNVSRTAAAIGFARQSLQEKIKELGILRAG
jgi:two-component system nitrogen regulation response regulator NtrX